MTSDETPWMNEELTRFRDNVRRFIGVNAIHEHENVPNKR